MGESALIGYTRLDGSLLACGGVTSIILTLLAMSQVNLYYRDRQRELTQKEAEWLSIRKVKTYQLN
ncbi:hypothetical protein CLV58_109125 [Spirosoma oryzae]|uniref:Uncharacterized protein n=2 Tax=Spirosoma oryzae TaxID=1469603 RepID=A0A2T0SY97_9BACT|nr:hypothetical protein CLV58_109125 [Spirosoma oryzae]